MTNFLTRLAARSFGIETGVRPRLASIFEPNRGVAPASRNSSPREFEDTSEISADPEADDLRNRGRIRKPPEPKHKATDSSSKPEQESPYRSDAAPSKPARPQIEEVRTDRVQSSANPPLVRRHRPSLEKLVMEHPRTQPAAQHLENEQRVEPPSFAWPTPHAQGATNKPVPSPSDEGNDGHEDRVASDFKPARRPDADSRQTLLQPSPAIAGLAERMRDAASAINSATPARGNNPGSDRPAIPAAEPIVHVTIGRVEVRATPEAPREKKLRASSPVIGLEEYLQSHSQRGGK